MRNSLNNAPCSICSVREIKNRSVIDDYSDYYNRIRSNLGEDSKAVSKKRLKFLKETYAKLMEELEYRLNVEKCYSRLFLIDDNKKARVKLKKYIDNTLDIYESINGSETYQDYYRHYDDLGSWYSAQIDSMDRVLTKLSKSESSVEREAKIRNVHLFLNLDKGEYKVHIIK